ncbi:hypothetical protein [Phormidesmis priestleyi]|uniref:hypothetical protein n=1 Tax=Phormidesmis priestleyi TaxID=268141 RepID=UPI00083B4961|nr:hypothetical protein [Phormidesmis priestleyi]
MSIQLEDTLKTSLTHSTDLLNSADVLDAMIGLRIQLRTIEEQIQALQPAFFTACLALNTDKITDDARIDSFLPVVTSIEASEFRHNRQHKGAFADAGGRGTALSLTG